MWRLYYSFLFLGLYLDSVTSRHVYFYRRDYTYIQEYDAFFKLHSEQNLNSWDSAFMTCEDEGAKMFYPKEVREQEVVQKLMEQTEGLPNVTNVFIGIHNKYHIGEYITVDGHTVPSFIRENLQKVEGDDRCIIMNASDSGDFSSSSCVNMLSVHFICTKHDIKKCSTIDQGYKYYSNSRKCYKLNKIPRKWEEAMQTCYSEGGLLAVVDNDMSALQFYNVFQMQSSNVFQIQSSTEYYIGIRDLLGNGKYYTVKGNQYEGVINRSPAPVTPRSGLPFAPDDMSSREYRNMYNLRNDAEVPRQTTEVSAYCGVLYNNNVKAIPCDEERPFICEMDT